jgi:CubicO group peptidase (beta-lactamase class C family)
MVEKGAHMFDGIRRSFDLVRSSDFASAVLLALLRNSLIPVLLLSSTAALAQQAAPHCAFPAAHLGGPVNAHTRFVEKNLLPAIVEAGTKPFALEDRMRAYGVPGVSVALVNNGKLEWARGWGVRDANTCAPVTPETDFQAASISKVVTALVALRLVEQGKLSLEKDINSYLTSWRLPRNEKLAPKSITLRELLSHTAGVNVHGFPGYTVGAQIPTAVQVLNGEAPAVTEAVKVVLPVDQQWQYSGGGYVITQVALSDATGVPFDKLAEQEVLRPLGMHRSAFTQPPPSGILSNAALGHVDGRVIAGGYHIYPELGPAGLWTTPADLARLLTDIQASANGRPSTLLSSKMTAQMLTPVKGNWGLGPALFGAGADRRFGHDGVNEGFQCTMVAYVHKGDGVVVMTNGGGKRLADEIVRAVATDYGWNELAGKPILEARISPDALARLVGRYEGSGMSVYLDLRDAHLFAQTGGPDPERLIALTPERFKTEGSGIVVEFQSERDGRVSGFRIVEGGPPIALARTEDVAADPFASPVFLRGSMNGWNESAPLVNAAEGTLAVEMPLAVGDYQFKFGSADWRAADFGSIGTTPINGAVNALPLIPHGGNIRLTVTTPGTYRFELKRAGSTAAFTLRKVDPGSGS